MGNVIAMTAERLRRTVAPRPAGAVPAANDGAACPPRILVVDDNAEVLEIFLAILGGHVGSASTELDALEISLFAEDPSTERTGAGFHVDVVSDGEQGVARVQAALDGRWPYAVAFVDMRMPGGWDGLRTIEALWGLDPDLQVVICTAYADYSWREISARLGRSDRLLVLRKPFEAIEVLQLACALSEKWRLHQEQRAHMDELERRVEERTHRLHDALHVSKALEGQLRFHAEHDMLTGLPNRRALEEFLGRSIAEAGQAGNRVGVLFLDLDRFKLINDSFGHLAGDHFLKVVGRHLGGILKDRNVVARLGGDEFVIILPDIRHSDEAVIAASAILDAAARPIAIDADAPPDADNACPDVRWCTSTSCGDCTRCLRVSASIGISVYPEHGHDPATLLKNADSAMYRAKGTGGNCYRIYAPEMSVDALQRIALESALHGALARQEFALHYQPKLDLKTGRICGIEALIRWNRPDATDVSPSQFIPLAEEIGLIVPIGEWVLRTACLQAAAWHRAGYSDLSVAVNLSGRQFQDADVPALVRAVLAETGLAANRLELELTESVLMEDTETAIQVLRELKAIGVTLSLDDFGTGYSSLSYLKRFPIDTLKIDRSFIRDVTRNVDDAALTRAIIAMARSLNIATVAEGVETEGQLALVQRSGCDAIQGYFFSRPVPADQLTELLCANRQSPVAICARSDERLLLLVDDEPGVLAALKRVLRRQPYRVLTATCAVDALEMLAIHAVQVIISDARMPGMSGIELLSRVKGLYPKTIRIMLSGYTELNTVTAAINDGAVYKFLTKPWDDNLIIEEVAHAFRLHEASALEPSRK